MAMRDDAKRLLDELPDEKMTAVVQFLKSIKTSPEPKHKAVGRDPQKDAALTELVRLSEDAGLYQQDYSDYYARFKE